MRLISNGFPNQYNVINHGNHCANIYTRDGRWYHDQGTCPTEGFDTKDQAAAAVDPAWRYVGKCTPQRHSSTF